MSKLKSAVINDILAVEGGYANDPSDSGGETNYGITVATARAYGYQGSMRDMPVQVARRIYSAMYWDALLLDAVEATAPAIAEELADTGVNQGVKRAGEYLQRSLNVLNDRGRLYGDLVVDGVVGPKTVNALNDYISHRGEDGVTVMLRMLNALQGAFYVDLAERREKDETYVYGWFLNRVA